MTLVRRPVFGLYLLKALSRWLWGVDSETLCVLAQLDVRW